MRASSPRESSGVAGLKASSRATTLLITDRPRHSVLPPATTVMLPAVPGRLRRTPTEQETGSGGAAVQGRGV